MTLEQHNRLDAMSRPLIAATVLGYLPLPKQISEAKVQVDAGRRILQTSSLSPRGRQKRQYRLARDRQHLILLVRALRRDWRLYLNGVSAYNAAMAEAGCIVPSTMTPLPCRLPLPPEDLHELAEYMEH